MFRKVLPHVAIIISCMYFVFFFIDRVNPMMNFIDNDMTKFLLVALGVTSICNAIVIVHDDRRRTRRQHQHRRQHHESERG